MKVNFDKQNNDFNKRFNSNEENFDKIDRRFDAQNSNFNKKFEEQNIQLLQSISVNFDELINDVQEKNKCLENTNEIIRNNLNKLEQSKSNTNENCNDMCRNVVLDEESTNKNNLENSNVTGEVVSESDMLKINNESTDEFVECDNEMLMCVYELEREWKDNIVVEWGQRVNFPLIIYDEPEGSQVLFLKGKRPVLIDVYKRQVNNQTDWQAVYIIVPESERGETLMGNMVDVRIDKKMYFM